MNTHYGYAILASLFAAGVTTAGLYVIRRFETWGQHNATYFSCFAAGVLISVSFLHIIPHAFHMNEQAPLYLLAGYLAFHLINRFIHAYVCDSTPDNAIGLIPLLGIGLHSTLDGVVYAITFSVSVLTGTLAGIGMVLHEFPEGIVTYVLLLRSGFTPKKSWLWAFLASALTTPIGTLLAIPMIHQINETVLGALLAVSAGAFVYVGATHLLPLAEREDRPYSLAAMGGGVVVALGIILTHG
ncbi:MAG: ZIP family metal transporter [Nitrospirales bacterium]|nr:ZIP family metal transporter [Nitrospirales bacterium]